jgi:hypothetical protein
MMMKLNRKGSRSRHGDHSRDLGHLVADAALDAHLKRHGTAWAANAGTVKADLHLAVVRDRNKLNISAIILNGGADQFNDFANLLVQVGRNRLCRSSWQRSLLMFQLPNYSR